MTLAPPDPTRADLTRHSLLWFNRSLMLRGVFDTICGGTTFMLVSFALSLGIAGESMARITMALSLGCLFQMLALPLIQRLADRKRFVVRTGALEPMVVILAVLLVPMLPPSLRLAALAVAMFAAASFLHVNKPIVDDWVASTVPGGIRGKYLGRRWQLYTAVILVCTLLCGWIGDWVRGDTYALAGVLAFGGAFGLLAVAAVSRAHMPVRDQPPGLRLADLQQVWTHRPYRRFVIGQLLYNTAFFMAVPFYQVFYLAALNMPTSWIAYLLVLYGLTKVFVLQFSGGWVDRVGPRRAVMIVAPLYVLFFALIGISQKDMLWPLYLAWLLGGLGDGVFAVCANSSLYATVPRNGPRPAFFAVYNLVAVGGFILGAPLAEWFVRQLADVRLEWHGWTFGQYHLFFLGAAAVCAPTLLGGLLFAGKRAEEESPAEGRG